MQLQSRSVCLIWKRLRHKFCHYKMKKSLKNINVAKDCNTFFFSKTKINKGWMDTKLGAKSWLLTKTCQKNCCNHSLKLLGKKIQVLATKHTTLQLTGFNPFFQSLFPTAHFFLSKNEKASIFTKKNLPPKNIGAMMICTFFQNCC